MASGERLEVFGRCQPSRTLPEANAWPGANAFTSDASMKKSHTRCTTISPDEEIGSQHQRSPRQKAIDSQHTEPPGNQSIDNTAAYALPRETTAPKGTNTKSFMDKKFVVCLLRTLRTDDNQTNSLEHCVDASNKPCRASPQIARRSNCDPLPQAQLLRYP